jgi:hypothetical protein
MKWTGIVYKFSNDKQIAYGVKKERKKENEPKIRQYPRFRFCK